MAKPIKETPILEGKDAKAFIKKIEDTTNNKVSAKEKERMEANFSKLSALFVQG